MRLGRVALLALSRRGLSRAFFLRMSIGDMGLEGHEVVYFDTIGLLDWRRW
jgi:hypothetical protein